MAFKDGKRVSITEAGAQLTGPENLNDIPAGSINPEHLSFRVQVGTFAGNVPMETMSKYVDLGNVKPVAGESVVRYLYGEYASRAAAEEARNELQNLGFKDAFVVGEMNGRIIKAEDAQKLLEGK
ncbi:MAG: SPOR domain-containing protein [Flavobacteriales bacterium]|nr:SPOR domain-containing protein [Flavobacteriales bacterium]